MSPKCVKICGRGRGEVAEEENSKEVGLEIRVGDVGDRLGARDAGRP